MSGTTLTAGDYSGNTIEGVPTWYLGRLQGSTTYDGVTLSSADLARVQFELLARADPDWRDAAPLKEGVIRFATVNSQTVKFAVNSEEINLAAATNATAVSSTANLLPANSVILAVKVVCTLSLTVNGTVTAYAVGDTNLASGAANARFFDACDRLFTGDSDIRFMDFLTNATDDYAGSTSVGVDAVNATAGVVKILVNGNTTTGKVKVFVLYGITA